MNFLTRTRVILPALTLAFAASVSGSFAATFGYDSVSNVEYYVKNTTFGEWSAETVTNTQTETYVGSDGRTYTRTTKTYEKSRTAKDLIYVKGQGSYENRENLSFDLDSRFSNVDKGSGINRGQWVHIDGQKVHSDTTIASGNFHSGQSEVTWGKKFGQWDAPSYDQQSRYNVRTDWHPYGSAGSWLKLADFTHTNRQIWKPIVSADLDLRIDVGNGARIFNQTWNITHDETVNLYGDDNADRVSMWTSTRNGNIVDSFKFYKDGTLFTLWITNFQNTDFYTNENGQTTTSLYAYFTSLKKEWFDKYFSANRRTELMTRSEVHEEMIADVPLPAGLPLLVAGLGSIAFLRRRQKRAA